MTTIIATKDKILSDGLITLGSRIDCDNFKKIRKIDGYLVGGAGRLSSILTFFSWYETKLKMEELQENIPELVIDSDPEKEDEEFMALVVHPDGKIFLHEGNDPTRAYELEVDYYSIGSGSDYAMAALDAKTTPEEALEIAKYRDIYSGGLTFTEVLNEETLLSEDFLDTLSRDDLLQLVKTGHLVKSNDSEED